MSPEPVVVVPWCGSGALLLLGLVLRGEGAEAKGDSTPAWEKAAARRARALAASVDEGLSIVLGLALPCLRRMGVRRVFLDWERRVAHSLSLSLSLVGSVDIE